MIITKDKNGIKEFYWDNNKYLGHAYVEVDGFYVFVFDVDNGGSWSDYALIAIADKLTELNKSWEEDIEKYFVKENLEVIANHNVFNAERFYLDELE